MLERTGIVGGPRSPFLREEQTVSLLLVQVVNYRENPSVVVGADLKP